MEQEIEEGSQHPLGSLRNGRASFMPVTTKLSCSFSSQGVAGYLAVSRVQDLGGNEIWILFGASMHFRYHPNNSIVEKPGPNYSRAFPVFHSITACDTISFFSGKTTSVWDKYNGYRHKRQHYSFWNAPNYSSSTQAGHCCLSQIVSKL